MKIEQAKEICDHMYPEVKNPGHLIRAIKVLRAETNMGLVDAKRYLESREDKASLYYSLIQDFVTSKQDQLDVLLVQHRILTERIYQLQEEILEEGGNG